MLLVCGSVSGSPGVSTVAAGLAAAWPQPWALLVEADPSGGVLAARWGMAQQPGLASLAAAARHGGRLAGAVSPHVQRLPIGINAVLAPGQPDVAAGSVEVLARQAHTTFRTAAPVMIVDVGRWYPGSPATPLIAAADVMLWLVKPTTEHLDHLHARLASAPTQTGDAARTGLLLAGDGPYLPAEISDRLDIPVSAWLPHDRRGAAALTGQPTGRAWQRGPLHRALRNLALTLARPPRRPAPPETVLR